MVMVKRQEKAKIPILMEIGMMVLGRTMSGRAMEPCTWHQGISSRVHGQMMPCTVLGYIPMLMGIGRRGSGRRGSIMAASPSTVPMETGRCRSGGRGSLMAAAPSTVPMETGRRGSAGRGSVMAAAPSTMPMETGRCSGSGRGSLIAADSSTQPTVCCLS